VVRKLFIFCLQYLSYLILIVTFYLMLIAYSLPLQSQTKYLFTITIFITVTFHTNTHSANVDVGHAILTSISVNQDQRNANPNVKSNATQRHLHTRKRNPEFDWSTADGTKSFEFCLHRKAVRTCTWRHVDSSGVKFAKIFWENETYKAVYVCDHEHGRWMEKNSIRNGETIWTLCWPLQ
jgi:hypothetical protein